MLTRDVWGWRVLVLLLTVLLISTIPQLGHLEEEWSESIKGTYLSEEVGNSGDEQSTNENDLAENETAENETTGNGDTEEGFVASEDDKSSSDDAESDSAPNTGEFRESESSDSIPKIAQQSEWILPATQVIVITMMAIMAVGLITSTATAIFASEGARFAILLAVMGPLLAITQRGEAGVFTRGRLLGFIEAHPGIHFSALRDALQLGNGVTAHHIQILEKEGRVISWMDGRVRRFASSGVDHTRLKEIQNPVTGMQIAILQILSESGSLGIQSGQLRTKLQTSRQLLSYHMKQLSERNFVESNGKGRALHWLLLEEGKIKLENSAHLVDIA